MEIETKEPDNFSKNVDLCPAYVGKHELAFVRHLDFMDLRCVTLEGYKAFKYELRTFIAGKWAILARLELMMPIEVAFQRILTAEIAFSFIFRQPGVADAK